MLHATSDSAQRLPCESDAESASWGQEAAKSQKLENLGVQIPRARCSKSGAFGPFFSPEGGPPFGGGPKCQKPRFLKEAPWTAILTPENRIERFDPRTRVRDRVFENIL